MAKKFSKFEKSTILTVAKTCYTLMDKKAVIEKKIGEERAKMEEKLAAKTASLNGELQKIDNTISGFEASVANFTGGSHPTELVQRTFEEVTDKDGKVSQKARFTFIEEQEETGTEESPEEQAETQAPVEAQESQAEKTEEPDPFAE